MFVVSVLVQVCSSRCSFSTLGSCQELTDGYRRVLNGHTDAVWDLVELPGPNGVLVSCAADSTCRLWRHDAVEPLVATIHMSAGALLLV